MVGGGSGWQSLACSAQEATTSDVGSVRYGTEPHAATQEAQAACR
jgi:hypothetical protein